MQNLRKVLDRNLSATNTLLCGYFEGDVLKSLASFLPEAKIGVHTSYAQCLKLATDLAQHHPQLVFSSFAKGFEEDDPQLEQLTQALELCPLSRGKEALTKALYTIPQSASASISSSTATNSLLDLRELFLAVQPQQLLLVFPKSKEEFYLQLLELKRVLQSLEAEPFYQQLAIFIVGDNDSGIKTLSKLVSPSQLVDNANRARLYCIGREFEISDHLAKKVKAGSYSFAGGEIYSLPGVFSSNRLDKGTELLLSTYADLDTPANQHLKSALTAKQEVRILDYACGAGVITKYIAQELQGREPQASQYYDLVDVQLPALLSAALNLKDQVSEQVHFNLQALSSLAEGKALGINFPLYQEIVSNPPFHSGQEEDISIFSRLVIEGKNLLAPQGCMRIVANSHLPYLSILEEHFKKVAILVKDKGFTVYLASDAKQS